MGTRDHVKSGYAGMPTRPLQPDALNPTPKDHENTDTHLGGDVVWTFSDKPNIAPFSLEPYVQRAGSHDSRAKTDTTPSQRKYFVRMDTTLLPR